MAINYDNKLLTRLRRDVKNFNAKRRALFNKGISPALLPAKASTKELRAGFTNRRELMDRLKELEDFSAAGKVYRSAGGVRGTEKLFNYVQKIGRKRARKLNRKAERLKGAGNVQYPVMLNEAVLNLSTKASYLGKNVRFLTPDQLRTYQKTSVKPEVDAARNKLFYKNFYKMMLQEASQADLDPDIMIQLLQQFRELSPEELLEAYNANPEFRNIVEYSNTPKSNRGSIIDDKSLNAMLVVLRDRMPEIIKDIRANGLK